MDLRVGMVLTAVVCAASGCANNQRELHNWLMAYQHQTASIEYRVGVPDAISISAPRVPEIDGVDQTIQPDGKITLRLLGEVRVDGMTTKEIAAKLTRLLREYYEDPKVQVRVGAYRSKKIYVYGQIATGGGSGGGFAEGNARTIAYTGRNTLMDTLATAGLSFIAWRSQIRVIRADPEKHNRHAITVDIDQIMVEGDTSMNVLLEPGDIVYVPPTPLGWVGLRIQEVLFPFGPIMNAYTFPAEVMDANDQYTERD